MSWDVNPYVKPEAYGLTVLASLDWHDEPYEFDMTVAWTDESGTLYWASDSGCSCPSPFEEFSSIDDLRTGGIKDLFQELDRTLEHPYWDDGTVVRVAQFKEEVLRKWR